MTDSFRDHLQSALGPAYTLDRELAGGGMSRVFVARERALDREVVVKVLPPDLAAGVNRERFRREIQLAAQLQHPHIVPLLAAGESEDLLYYTMPFIRGQSLRTAIETRGELALRDVVSILHDVVDALAYAHEHGVIHRDIKPANVLMSGSHALITDFGVAKALSAALPISGVTTTGVAIGTPAYMAPEQLAGDPSADHRVDLYAVGLLAYELLSGSSPFAGGSPQATMAAQLTRVPEPIETVRPDVPPELSRIIQRCLAKFPSDRPTTARDLLAELDSIAPGTTVLSGILRRQQRRSLPPRRIVAAASVVLTVAIISALAIGRGRTEGSPAAEDARTAIPAPPAPTPAPAARPTVPATASPSTLTREDSLAIARAVRQRAARSGSATDSLRHLMELALADSVRTARTQLYMAMMDTMRIALDSLELRRPRRSPTDIRITVPRPPEVAPQGRRPPSGPDVARINDALRLAVAPWAGIADSLDPAAARRVAIAATFGNASKYPQLDRVAHMAADSLRKLLRSRGSYEIVSPASGGSRVVGDPFALAREERAPTSIVGNLRSRGDSVYLWLYVSDLRRGPRFRAFSTEPAPLDDPVHGLDRLAVRVLQWLDREGR